MTLKVCSFVLIKEHVTAVSAFVCLRSTCQENVRGDEGTTVARPGGPTAEEESNGTAPCGLTV